MKSGPRRVGGVPEKVRPGGPQVSYQPYACAVTASAGADYPGARKTWRGAKRPALSQFAPG